MSRFRKHPSRHGAVLNICPAVQQLNSQAATENRFKQGSAHLNSVDIRLNHVCSATYGIRMDSLFRTESLSCIYFGVKLASNAFSIAVIHSQPQLADVHATE
jgi:hypothetical protein